MFLFTDIKFGYFSLPYSFLLLQVSEQTFSNLALSELMMHVFIMNVVITFEDLIDHAFLLL